MCGIFLFTYSVFLEMFVFSVHKSFTSLVNFIPKYLILFDVLINRIAFLISFQIVHY